MSADAVTCREFTVGTGSVDVVAVEPTGKIHLVECKLAKNPQVRREVIGQLFDYASHLWQVPLDAFAEEWRRRTGTRSPVDEASEEFRDEIARNLNVGRFRLVLAVDEINPQLRRMVEYLNMMAANTTVIAVEYIRYEHDEVEILTPRIYGLDLAEAKEHSRPGAWTLQDYRAGLLENEPSTVANFDALVVALETVPMSFLSGSGQHPSGRFSYQSRDGGLARPLHLATRQRALLELNFADWLVRWQSEGRDTDAIDRVKRNWGAVETVRSWSTRSWRGRCRDTPFPWLRSPRRRARLLPTRGGGRRSENSDRSVTPARQQEGPGLRPQSEVCGRSNARSTGDASGPKYAPAHLPDR